MYHESTRCISILFYTNKHDKIKENCVVLENIRILGPLIKTGLHLIGNVSKPLAKSVFIPLGLTAAASATDAAIHKKMFGSGTRPSDLALHTILIISNEEMNDFMKLIKSLEESELLIKGVSKTMKN